MSFILIKGKKYKLDKYGCLEWGEQWTKDWTEYWANEHSIILTERHWEIIDFLRDYFERYTSSPMEKVLLKDLKRQLLIESPEEYLKKLFHVEGRSSARIAILYAGLPTPTAY